MVVLQSVFEWVPFSPSRQGAFKNYVDKILDFFDPPPLLVDNLFNKKLNISLIPLTPMVVYVVLWTPPKPGAAIF